MQNCSIPNQSLKGREFEQEIFYGIVDLMKSLESESSRVYNEKIYPFHDKTFFLLRNHYIGGHETDLAIVDKAMYRMVENKATESEIGNRKSGYFMNIECKNYESNIKSWIGADLIAKNNFLKPNNSLLIKQDNQTKVNWIGNFDVANVEILANNEFIAKDIITRIWDTSRKQHNYQPIFNSIESEIKKEIIYKSRYNTEEKTGLENLVYEDFMNPVYAKTLKNSALTFNNNPTRIEAPIAVLYKNEICFVRHIKNLTLCDARISVGNSILANARTIIHYNTIYSDAEAYIASHHDIISAKKIK